jgi:hypothetical protein
VKVVVVGNSRDLVDRDDGSRIDACDRIIRLNSFRLAGFERRVGSRVDIVSLCLSPSHVAGALVHSAGLIRRARELWTPAWRGQAPKEAIDRAIAAIGCQGRDVVFSDDTGDKAIVMALYDLVYRTAAQRQGPKTQARDGSKFLPTTGFQTVHLARARFPGADLYITGFGLNSPLDLRRFDTSGVGIWPGHDIPAERQLLLEGVASGHWKKL